MASLEEMWLVGALADKHSKQLIGLAGDGNIHTSRTSHDLRGLLKAVNLEDLERFARECLESGFNYSGQFLQDVVNELGSRLGFAVEFGRYQGSSASPAPDGIWRSPEWTFIVEVKTTDAYRISLDRLAVYRVATVRSKDLALEETSVLIVVGRQDTGELEAQVRGSKHAWDIRLVGVEALFKLAFLHRDSVEQESVLDKMRAILRPSEYTRVDGLLEVVFETALAAGDDERNDPKPTESKPAAAFSVIDATESAIVKEQLRQAVVRAMQNREQKRFKKVRRSLYESLDASVRFSLAISKNYGSAANASFWYAYHPTQANFVEGVSRGSAIFACEGINLAVALPAPVLRAHLSQLSQTQSVDRPSYWHVFVKTKGDQVYLETKKDFDDVDVTAYVIGLKDALDELK